MVKNICLVLLSPAFCFRSMKASLGVAAKLTDDERLVKGNLPLCGIRSFRTLFIPAYVLIGADYIQRLAQRIVHDLQMAFGSDEKSRRHQTRRIKLAHVSCQRLQKLCSLRRVRRFICDRP